MFWLYTYKTVVFITFIYLVFFHNESGWWFILMVALLSDDVIEVSKKETSKDGTLPPGL